MKKILFFAVMLAAVSGAVVYYLRPEPDAAPGNIEPASVSADTIHYPPGAPQLAYLKIQAVHAAPAPLFAPVTARLIYNEDLTYRAISPVSGRIVEILANPGDHVRRGQALARIVSPDFGSALADNDKAQADLRVKRATHQRAGMLLDAGVLARKDFESAEADLRIAEAEAQRVKDHLRSLGASSGRDFALRSQIDGIVAERQVSIGQEVRGDAMTPLFIVTNPEHLWLSVDVSEQDIGLVRRGQALDMQLDAYPDEHFHAAVTSVGVSLDPVNRRLPVIAAIDNLDGRLHPEMFAHVYPVDEKRQPMIVLPNSAIFTKGLYSYVWVETASGTLQRRRVNLALRLADRSFVSDGVTDGERVVTTGALLLEADTTAG